MTSETDIDYEAVFGIEIGENEQEAAEPATDTEEEQGEKEQEVAEPASDKEATKEGGEAEENEPPDMEEKTETTPEEKGGAQPQGERAQYAAARRKAEAEAAAKVQQAKDEAQAQAERFIQEAFQKLGAVNPYTGQSIASKADYEAYRRQYEELQKDKFFQQSGMDKETFERFVADLPEVRAAKEAQAQAVETQRKIQEEQARARVAEDLREIGAINPDIKELGDLAKMDTYPRLYALVQRGNTLADAYKLANIDALTESKTAAAKQKAINAARSKEHLSGTVSRGAGATPVPADVKAAYLDLNPQATEAEIREHYNKYLKQ